jgi:phage anti-repressor protein
MVQELQNNFNEDEKKWFIANLYMYLNYHPTNDYPINLEDAFKIIGFANKGNAMKTIKSNFILNEDYKLLIIPREKKQNAGRSEHEIMLNIDTFKSLCIISKTVQGKSVRKYYIKMENMYNKLINEERIEYETLLKQKTIQNIQDRQVILLNSYHKKCIVYLIFIQHNLYKFGFTDNIKLRMTYHLREIGKETLQVEA